MRAAGSDAEQPAADKPRGNDGVSKKPLLDGLGLSLGPVAMTYEGSSSSTSDKGVGSRLANATGVTLGPIALSLGESAVRERGGADEAHDKAEAVRLNALTSEDWRQAHLTDGALRGCCAAPAFARMRGWWSSGHPTQMARWICGWRTTSTPRRACLPAGRMARVRMWPGPARRRLTRTWRSTP